MWFLFQTAVFCAVIFWLTTKDAIYGFGYAPAFLAGLIAWAVSVALSKAIDLLRVARQKRPSLRIDQGEKTKVDGPRRFGRIGK